MKWISVKERAIPTGVNVLVADFSGYPRISIMHQNSFVSDIDKEYNALVGCTDKLTALLKYDDITHWMFICDLLLPKCRCCK